MNADEEVGTGGVGRRDPVVERDVAIRIPRQHHPKPVLPFQHVAERERHREGHVLLGDAAPAGGAAIGSSVPRINGDRADFRGRHRITAPAGLRRRTLAQHFGAGCSPDPRAEQIERDRARRPFLEKAAVVAARVDLEDVAGSPADEVHLLHNPVPRRLLGENGFDERRPHQDRDPAASLFDLQRNRRVGAHDHPGGPGTAHDLDIEAGISLPHRQRPGVVVEARAARKEVRQHERHEIERHEPLAAPTNARVSQHAGGVSDPDEAAAGVETDRRAREPQHRLPLAVSRPHRAAERPGHLGEPHHLHPAQPPHGERRGVTLIHDPEFGGPLWDRAGAVRPGRRNPDRTRKPQGEEERPETEGAATHERQPENS